jgi:hypothetical protein
MLATSHHIFPAKKTKTPVISEHSEQRKFPSFFGAKKSIIIPW